MKTEMHRQAAKATVEARIARRSLAKAAGVPDPGPKGEIRLSEIIVEKVKRRVASGALEPTVSDGLKAEGLIDKRIARIDDRATAISLAMILSGASGTGPPAHLLIGDGNEVEGEFTETDV